MYQEYYYWILYEHSKLDEYESTQDVLEFLKNQAGYINFVYAEKEHKKKNKKSNKRRVKHLEIDEKYKKNINKLYFHFFI